MAPAKAKKRPVHKSYAANPPKSRYKAPAKKTNPKRRKAAASMHKRSTRRRKSYRRNPGIAGNAALIAIGGALAILGFNEIIARFFPQLGAGIRIAGKAAAGWAVGRYGRPYLGTWATVIQGGLWLAAASEAINAFVVPHLPAGWITNGQPAVVSTQQVQNPTSGQLGTRYNLADGNSIDVYEGNSQMAYA